MLDKILEAVYITAILATFGGGTFVLYNLDQTSTETLALYLLVSSLAVLEIYGLYRIERLRQQVKSSQKTEQPETQQEEEETIEEDEPELELDNKEGDGEEN